MTDIVRGLDQEGMEGMLTIGDWKSLDQGVATNLVAAFDPALDGKLYTYDCEASC